MRLSPLIWFRVKISVDALVYLKRATRSVFAFENSSLAFDVFNYMVILNLPISGQESVPPVTVSDDEQWDVHRWAHGELVFFPVQEAHR